MSASTAPYAAGASTAQPARRPHRRGAIFMLFLLLLLTCGVCVARLMIGESFGWPQRPDVLSIRLDHMLIAVAVGAALAVSGAILQALLRNPLASPYILGISSGAALGVMLSWIGWISFAGRTDDSLAALAGAVVTMAAVYLLAQRRGRIDPLGLLLVGVIVNAINGAAIMFIQYRLPPHGLGQTMRWFLGYLNADIGRETIYLILAITAVGALIATLLGRAMDVATFSDAESHSLGVSLPRLRLWLFLLAGVLTAGSVVLAGPIAFVGLIGPHVVRLLIGPSHRALLIGSALAGAALVVGADVAVELLDMYGEVLGIGRGRMPIGVLTAIIGGPVFLILLRPQLGRGIQ